MFNLSSVVLLLRAEKKNNKFSKLSNNTKISLEIILRLKKISGLDNYLLYNENLKFKSDGIKNKYFKFSNILYCDLKDEQLLFLKKDVKYGNGIFYVLDTIYKHKIKD